MKLFVLIALLSTTLCAAVCTGCGRNGGAADTLFGATTADNPRGSTPHHDYTQEIAELALAPTPDGVEHTLWKELTAALADALAERQASDAPLVERAKVNDLSYSLTADPTTTFSWKYLNPGDYDLNGEVNLADLAKIADNYMASEADPDWADAMAADGDGNGEITLADVTPIALSYMAVVSGYVLQASDAAMDEPWTDVGQVEYADATVPEGGGLPRFNLDLAAPEYGKYYRVVPIEKTSNGEAVFTNTGATGVPVLFTPDARGDWHTRGRDAQHTSLSTHEGPTTNHVYWTHEIGGWGRSSPVYNIAGTIYVGGGDGLYIINPDHTSVSVYPTPDVVETTPAIAKDGTVYFGCNDGVFRALYPGGGLKWSFTTGDEIHCSPTVAEDGTVYFGSHDGNLYALAPDGSLKWTYESEEPVTHPPALTSDGHIFAVVNGNRLQYLDENGQVDWDEENGLYSNSTPVVGQMYFNPWQWVTPLQEHEGLVETAFFYVDYGLRRYPIDQTLPSLYEPFIWPQFELNLYSYALPALSLEGGLYSYGSDGLLSRFASDGNIIWSIPFYYSNYRMLSPSVDNVGTVYVGQANEVVVAINSDGTGMWSLPLPGYIGSQVAISDSTIFAVDTDGWLYAIGGPHSGTIPDTPTNFTAWEGVSTVWIDVEWDEASGAEGYQVFRDGIMVAESGQTTELRDSDLDSGVQYEYEVRAFNSVGFSEFSTPVIGYTSLASPESVTSELELFEDRIRLEWTDVDNETEYLIRRDSWKEEYYLATVPANTTSFEDLTLTDWDEHEYYVYAVNSFSTSKYRSTMGSQKRGVGDSGAGEWTQYGHDSSHRSRTNAIGPAAGIEAWHYQQVDTPNSSGWPAAFGSEGAIYVQYNNDLICLNPEGTLRWSMYNTCLGGSVAQDGSIVAVLDTPNDPEEMVVINPDGSIRLSSDLVLPGVLSVGDNGKFIGIMRSRIPYYSPRYSMLSINPDLTINWENDLLGYAINSPPAISPDGSIYYNSPPHASPSQGGGGDPPVDYPHPRDLVALDADGNNLWTYSSPDEMSIPVIMPSGNLLVATAENKLISVLPSGIEEWAIQQDAQTTGIAIDHQDHIVCAMNDGSVGAYSPDGDLLWNVEYPEYASTGFSGSPIVDGNDDIYLLGEANLSMLTLFSLDGSGNLRWSMEVGAQAGSGLAMSDAGQLVFSGQINLGIGYGQVVYAVGPN